MRPRYEVVPFQWVFEGPVEEAINENYEIIELVNALLPAVDTRRLTKPALEILEYAQLRTHGARGRQRVARSRNRTSAARSSGSPMVCSGILVPGVKVAGPSSNRRAIVSADHTMSMPRSAGEKL